MSNKNVAYKCSKQKLDRSILLYVRSRCWLDCSALCRTRCGSLLGPRRVTRTRVLACSVDGRTVPASHGAKQLVISKRETEKEEKRSTQEHFAHRAFLLASTLSDSFYVLGWLSACFQRRNACNELEREKRVRVRWN